MKFLKTRPGKILVIFINLIVFLILVFVIIEFLGWLNVLGDWRLAILATSLFIL